MERCALCGGDLRIAWQEGGGHSPDCPENEEQRHYASGPGRLCVCGKVHNLTASSGPEVRWSRAFRIVLPDYTVLDGIQFPSGRCVVDDPSRGQIHMAISLEELPPVKENPDAVIGWEPTGHMTAEELYESEGQ